MWLFVCQKGDADFRSCDRISFFLTTPNPTTQAATCNKVAIRLPKGRYRYSVLRPTGRPLTLPTRPCKWLGAAYNLSRKAAKTARIPRRIFYVPWRVLCGLCGFAREFSSLPLPAPTGLNRRQPRTKRAIASAVRGRKMQTAIHSVPRRRTIARCAQSSDAVMIMRVPLFNLFEAGLGFILSFTTPDCGRYAPLVWG